MKKETLPKNVEASPPQSVVEQRVTTVQRSMHTRFGSVLEWIDHQVDAIAMNIGDATVAGFRTFGKRLMAWEHPKKDQ